MTDFLFLFRNDQAAQRSLSPAQMEASLKKWMSWMDGLKGHGHLKNPGERLDSAGKVVRGQGKAVTDGPFAEAKDTIGGYMVIAAKDMDTAVELSRGCPILEAGGTVEIRPVIPM